MKNHKGVQLKVFYEKTEIEADDIIESE